MVGEGQAPKQQCAALALGCNAAKCRECGGKLASANGGDEAKGTPMGHVLRGTAGSRGKQFDVCVKCNVKCNVCVKKQGIWLSLG